MKAAEAMFVKKYYNNLKQKRIFLFRITAQRGRRFLGLIVYFLYSGATKSPFIWFDFFHVCVCARRIM